MAPKEKQLVRTSWALVVPIQEQAAELFYGRLFDQCPEVRPLFKDNMRTQGVKLMRMLDQAVASLDKIDALIEPLQQAGRAHRDYGVAEEDYGKVAGALLWTLEQGLGDDFSDDVKSAWTSTYTTLSSVMIDGADYGSQVAASAPRPWWKRMLSPAPA